MQLAFSTHPSSLARSCLALAGVKRHASTALPSVPLRHTHTFPPPASKHVLSPTIAHCLTSALTRLRSCYLSFVAAERNRGFESMAEKRIVSGGTASRGSKMLA